ncbi:hypothetical protein BVC80_9079g90 [Macleaya cordata]|uniref:DUF7356 domain-containing protein n=1 Tax=Macleaya cordata TaxID=56857 RepID=A0A200PUQ6_MACCD|nr:hypothetical protein BVC80_9079g90 [Macleaya cordata]
MKEMARSGTFLFCLVLFLFFVANCFGTESEVKTMDSTTKIDSKSLTSSNGSSVVEQTKSNSDTVGADHVMKGEDEDGGIQGANIDSGKSNSSMELGLKKNPEVLANTDDSSKELEMKKGEEKKQGNGEGSESKKVPKKGPTDGDDLVRSKPSRKETARGEECDSSNKCTDEKNKLIACLRVPGNDSPDYSLLIQNKGTSPLSVNISAPDYVQLEKSTIQLLQKEDKKVKVSIGDGGDNTLIILSAGKGQCSLDFHDLVLHNSGKKTSNSIKFSYDDLSSRAPSILYISLAALFLVGSVMLCVILRRRNLLPGDNSKYQKLETELPISGGAAKISEVTDGWDNSWGDDSWDDEEAPRTPSMPVTPSLSSKGLASRRSAKEGWKD